MKETMNANLDNIISRFKSDFPNLGISNIHLYMFLALNFSTSAICVLQDTTPDTLYSRKSKTQIEDQKHRFEFRAISQLSPINKHCKNSTQNLNTPLSKHRHRHRFEIANNLHFTPMLKFYILISIHFLYDAFMP